VAVEPGSDGSQQTGLFTGFDTPSVDDQLTELRLEVSHLYTELTALRVQYEDVNRHVLNAALRVGSSSELTRDDVSKLIDKMSMLMNRTALQWHQQQTARQGAVTPKGCPRLFTTVEFAAD
jgi:hypothetical protein